MTRDELLEQARTSARALDKLSDRARDSLTRDTDWQGARQSGYGVVRNAPDRPHSRG